MIVAVVDYRACNLTSVVKALAAAGATPRVVERTAGLSGASAILVPGVGHFEATRALDEDDRREIGRCVEAGVPLLGICLGMQWLFEGSDEAPGQAGLGVFAGRCVRIRKKTSGIFFDEKDSRRLFLKIPHVGWNTLEPTGRPSRLLDGMPTGATAYFTHSYAAPDGDGTVARTTHGTTFASVVERGRVFGTQFHPEKSGVTGIEMLKRFVAIGREANVQC